MYIVVSIFDRCMFPSFAYFFVAFIPTTDYLRQIYRHTRHSTLYNGTGPVYPHQRTGACKCHVIAAVSSLRVQKLTPAELRPFCHTKREDYIPKAEARRYTAQSDVPRDTTGKHDVLRETRRFVFPPCDFSRPIIFLHSSYQSYAV